MLTMTKL